MTIRPQYVIDEKGKRCSVLLTIKEYQELLERAQDVVDADLIGEVRDSARVSWKEVKARRSRRYRA